MGASFGRCKWIIIGSVSAAIAVAMGAFGAHGLESWLETNWPDDWGKRLANWKTAATYQMYHSIGMIAVGLVANFTKRRLATVLGGWSMIVGTLLFSGMLYGWVLLNHRLMVMIVPLGGLLFILSWVFLAIAAGGMAADSKKPAENSPTSLN